MPDALKLGKFNDKILVNGIEIEWDTKNGLCTFRGIPVALMWIDSTLAGLMAGVAAMVGPERFSLALQSEGRKSVESDWMLISSFQDFREGFTALNLNAAVAGWGDWQLITYDHEKEVCVFRAYNNWEGMYQKALDVCWGSGMLAGKFSGICSKLFKTNCWATQTSFVAKGDPYDEFQVTASDKNIEDEINKLLISDNATRADMAVALEKLKKTELSLREGIAERKRVAEQIEALVREQKAMLDTELVGIAKTRNRVITWTNPVFEKILGYDEKELIGLPTRVIYPTEESYNRFGNAAYQVLISSGAYRTKVEYIRKNGESLWVDMSGMMLDHATDEVMWVMIDITKDRKAEADLRVAAIVFESQEGMFVTDADRLILRVNHAFTHITGYTEQEVVGKSPSLLRSGRHDPGFYAAMWDCIDQTGGWSGEIWNMRKNGEIYPEQLSITAVKDPNGITTHYVATLTDITSIKAAAEEIENLAFYDPLTRLPNRRLLVDRLQQALVASTRDGRQGALLFLDLDHFKSLNDTLGHAAGDLLLQQVAERLTSCVREGDTVARLGGDEFVVLLGDLSPQANEAAAQAETVGNKILAALDHGYRFSMNDYQSSGSIGVTLFSNNEQAYGELLKQADIAMYQAKKTGRNTLRFFDPQMQASIDARAALESALRKAIENRQLHLYYQIQVDGSRRPVGAEALIRWTHPEYGWVSPLDFIPLAEETGLILPIGQWVLETACAQLKTWQQTALARDLDLSVNVSAKQIRHAVLWLKYKPPCGGMPLILSC